MSANQITILVLAILFTLLLRDLPYFNIIFISKMWIVYLVLFLAILLPRIRIKFSTFFYIAITLFGIGLISTLLQLKLFAETMGIILYFSLWVVWGRKSWLYFKEKS